MPTKLASGHVGVVLATIAYQVWKLMCTYMWRECCKGRWLQHMGSMGTNIAYNVFEDDWEFFLFVGK